MFGVSIVAGVVVGFIKGAIAQKDFNDEAIRADEAADLAWEQAQADAEAQLTRARAALDEALGALGAHTTELGGRKSPAAQGSGGRPDYDDVSTEYGYETYDDWYDATKAAYDAAVEDGLETSWNEYLRNQQIEELGTYGIRRAELELTVDIARRQFDLAEQNLNKAQQFIDRNWAANAEEAIRQHQTHQSAAGASGMRSGVAHETAKEYQVARMEGLNLWREESLYQISGKRKELGLKREELAGMEATGLAELDNFLAAARSGYELDVSDIYRGLGDIREQLDFNLDPYTGDDYRKNKRKAFWGNFLGGFGQGQQITMDVGETAGWVG